MASEADVPDVEGDGETGDSNKMDQSNSESVATAKDQGDEKLGSTSDEKQNEDEGDDKGEATATGDNKDEEAVVAAVVQRLRFFFSDANVRHDPFIRKLLLKDEGIVPIEALLKFNTIKQHTTESSVIVKAVKSDRLSDRIMLTEDSTGIKRVKPFTLAAMDDNIPLTLVVGNLPTKKGEGDDREYYAVKVDEIRQLFDQYGEVALVKLQFVPKETSAANPDNNDYHSANKNHHHKKARVPNGSAMVEFEEEESLKKAMEDVLTRKDGVDIEAKRKLELGGNVLTVTSLKEVNDELKKRPAEEEEEGKVDDADDQDQTKADGDNHRTDDATVYHFDWKPGCVIQLDGLPQSCDREALHDAMCKCLDKSLDEIKDLKIYTDYSRGNVKGALRFQEPEGAIQTVLAKLQSGEVEIAGQAVKSATILNGDEETKYWADFISFKTKQKRQKQEQQQHHWGGRRGGRGRGGGRGGGRGRGGRGGGKRQRWS